MSYCFKITILAETCIKCVILIEKLLRLCPQTPLPPVTGGFAPSPPAKPPPLRDPGYASEQEVSY